MKLLGGLMFGFSDLRLYPTSVVTMISAEPLSERTLLALRGSALAVGSAEMADFLSLEWSIGFWPSFGRMLSVSGVTLQRSLK